MARGSITLTFHENGLAINTKIAKVQATDRALLLKGLMTALEMSELEVLAHLAFMSEFEEGEDECTN